MSGQTNEKTGGKGNAETGAKSGMNYAPKGKPNQVVGPGEFVIAAIALDHGHIYGMCNGLVEAGATLKWVYDPDPKKVEAFQAQFPGVRAALGEEEILADEFHKGRQGVGSGELLALQWERICEELSGIPGETMSGENGHSKADMVRGFYVGLAQEYRRRFEV